MAHDGTGTQWDETSPAGSELRTSGDDEIRDLRKAVRIRLQKEHTTPATSSAGGEHKEGSAVGYSDPTTEPTLRPDGATALDADDEGRIFFKENKLFRYTGTEWKPAGGIIAEGTIVVDTSYSSFVNVAEPFRAIMFWHTAGQNFIVLCNEGADDELDANAIAADGTVRNFTVNCDQNSTDHRFRIKSTNATGTFRYRVLA